ncbi:MAG: rhamnulokinase family protein [Verrucomicrobiota bacterium]
MSHYYIACDLGADSGRVMLGHLDKGRLELEEVHRFPTGSSRVFGTLRLNVQRIFGELKIGLKKVADRNLKPESLSVDSWGVDYVLFNSKNPQLSVPFQYRDARTDATYERALKKATPEMIFENTGTQFMSINTLYQFVDDLENNPEVIALADQFLNIGDYLNYLFCGVARAEESIASTTQIYNPRTRAWSRELIELFGFKEAMFPGIVPSGSVLAPLLPDIASETHLEEVEVVATCTHDTGCAVAAVPAEGDDWAYLSSGTWSLAGVELPEPLINPAVLAANFTNESGFEGIARFLKNTPGMWLLQESKRTWGIRGIDLTYDEIDRLAAEAEPLRSIIYPSAARFLKPDQMPEKIQSYCAETGQHVPETPGQIARAAMEGLALSYRHVLEEICALTGRTIRKLHIVGGGSKNLLLNQLAADATGCTVITGPVEATAIGNVLIQAIALGHLKSLDDLRKTVRASFPVITYEPNAATAKTWEDAYERYKGFTVMS